jgi:hypothetical protein
MLFCFSTSKFPSMKVFDEVAEKLFGDANKRGRYGPDFASDYVEYEGDPMKVKQLKKIQDTNPPRSGNPNGFRNHQKYDYMYECLQDVYNEWSGVNIILDGTLGSPDDWWAETVYIFYDNVDDIDEFEEWAVLSFKSTLRGTIKGVSPNDPRITFRNECFRYPKTDDNLMVTTDECQFRKHSDHGKYLRLWWDD